MKKFMIPLTIMGLLIFSIASLSLINQQPIKKGQLLESNGQVVSIKNVIDKEDEYVIFFHKDCPHCQKALPHLNKSKKYVFISLLYQNDSKEDAKKYIDNLGLEVPYKLYFDENAKYMTSLNLRGAPSLLQLSNSKVILTLQSSKDIIDHMKKIR